MLNRNTLHLLLDVSWDTVTMTAHDSTVHRAYKLNYSNA